MTLRSATVPTVPPRFPEVPTVPGNGSPAPLIQGAGTVPDGLGNGNREIDPEGRLMAGPDRRMWKAWKAWIEAEDRHVETEQERVESLIRELPDLPDKLLVVALTVSLLRDRRIP